MTKNFISHFYHHGQGLTRVIDSIVSASLAVIMDGTV